MIKYSHLILIFYVCICLLLASCAGSGPGQDPLDPPCEEGCGAGPGQDPLAQGQSNPEGTDPGDQPSAGFCSQALIPLILLGLAVVGTGRRTNR